MALCDFVTHIYKLVATTEKQNVKTMEINQLKDFIKNKLKIFNLLLTSLIKLIYNIKTRINRV